MKYGIIYCGYNTEEYIHESLAPWVGREDCVISAVSVPFNEYSQQEFYEDRTTLILHNYLNEKKIGYLTTFPRFIKEHEARNLALRKIKEPVDAYFLVDSDEVYSKEDITRIFEFVETNPVCWYSVALRNFVFDTNTYLEEPFTPPRIFRTNFLGLTNPSFVWDNDMTYNHQEGRFVHTSIVGLDIPKEVAWVDHYSWLNNPISQRKVKYQTAHFKGICSYAWDEEKGLIFNEEYYKDKEKPKLLKR